jgi:hypothetical protein
MKNHEVGCVKWMGDLRFSKSRKNHKLKPMKYKEFTGPEIAKKVERLKEEAKALKSVPKS